MRSRGTVARGNGCFVLQAELKKLRDELAAKSKSGTELDVGAFCLFAEMVVCGVCLVCVEPSVGLSVVPRCWVLFARLGFG